MSQETVKIMQRVVEHWNAGDLDGVLAAFAADVVCFPAGDQPESESFRGREAFAKYAEGWLTAFEAYVMEVSEYLDFGDAVIIVGRVIGRGRESGVDVSAEDAWLYRFRNGEIVEYRECGTKEKALEAAGLRE